MAELFRLNDNRKKLLVLSALVFIALC